MFHAYWRAPERYNSRFLKGWYITGDKARRDQDGYVWFVGRADDVINTAGHLVGPFEVESALIEHPAVAEAGVIGKPDAIAMEVVKAFVALKDGYEPTEELRREINRTARARLAAAVAPREIEFVDSLPKTRSGKIMRRLLKARELGLPEGRYIDFGGRLGGAMNTRSEYTINEERVLPELRWPVPGGDVFRGGCGHARPLAGV